MRRAHLLAATATVLLIIVSCVTVGVYCSNNECSDAIWGDPSSTENLNEKSNLALRCKAIAPFLKNFTLLHANKRTNPLGSLHAQICSH